MTDGESLSVRVPIPETVPSTDLATPIDRSLLEGDPPEVAPLLLNKIISAGNVIGRIVEVEAYWGAHDPASHAYGGQTPRNATMFDRAGLLYVYRSYGIHWCSNIVLGPVGEAAAVLIRAVEPVAGVQIMSTRRTRAKNARDLTNGPGKLCAALGITGRDDGTDLLDPASHLRLLDDGTTPPTQPLTTSRIGITKATELHWRFAVRSNPWVSRGKPADG